MKLQNCEKVRRAREAMTKETTLERADFTFQQYSVRNLGKEEKIAYNFLSFQFLSSVVPGILS